MAKLRVQSIDNDLFLERKYHLCIKSIGGGQFLCLGVKGLDGIQPLDQDTINICESYHLPYISNRG